MHKTLRRIVAVFILYAFLAYGAMHLLNTEPSPAVERILAALAIPLNILTLPWITPLSSVGLTEGEWIRFPTLFGMLLVITLNALLLYLTLWLILSIAKKIRA